MTTKINLGCGNNYLEGYVNVDFNSKYKTDILADLEYKLPFEDNSVDEVYCSHVLEHLRNFLSVLKEIERITKVGALVHIRVPHFSNGLGHGDLGHEKQFGWETFDFVLKGYYNLEYRFVIEEKKFNYLSVNHKIINAIVNPLINSLPKQFYERFLCWIIPVGEIELKLRRTE